MPNPDENGNELLEDHRFQIPPEAITHAQELCKVMVDFQNKVIEEVKPDQSEMQIDMQASSLANMFYLVSVASMHTFGYINPGQMRQAIEGAVLQMEANFERTNPDVDRSRALN